MTATSQNQEPEGKSGLEPEKKPEGEPRFVPVGEFIEMRKELRSALEELKTLKGSASAPASKDSAAPKGQAVDELSKQVQALAMDNRITNIKAELGLAKREQAEAVAKFLIEAPNLTPAEAVTLLARRDPKLFGAEGQADEGQKPNFASLTPRPGSAPEPVKDDMQQRMEYIQKARNVNSREARRMSDNIAGHFLADALGWEHQLHPLPKQ